LRRVKALEIRSLFVIGGLAMRFVESLLGLVRISMEHEALRALAKI
jgi:hypothetical protein